MILTIRYWIRYFVTLCFIAAIAFMVACTVFVIVMIINGNIKIRLIKDEHDKKRKRKRR